MCKYYIELKNHIFFNENVNNKYLRGWLKLNWANLKSVIGNNNHESVIYFLL